MMKAITLRRMKDHKIDGKPILELPPRKEMDLQVVLTPKERILYAKIEDRALEEYNFMKANGLLVFDYDTCCL